MLRSLPAPAATLAAALLCATPAAALHVAFSATVDFAAAGNPFGAMAGDTVRGSLAFDPSASADPSGSIGLADDPTLRLTVQVGNRTLTEADATGVGGGLTVFLFAGAFDGFSFSGVTVEVVPGFPIPTIGVDLSGGFFGSALLTVSNLTAFVGATPVPFLVGDALIAVPGPAAAALFGVGLLGLAGLRRRD